ncbi:MAG: hypothetical protein IJ759_02730 [Bacteroidales bacterium]|nr:hypothetical protein [Bacteroidales bacterium]
MKRKKFYILLLLLSISLMSWGQDWEGDGSKDNPYQIKSENDLKTLSNNVNNKSHKYNDTCFILIKDIILTENFTPIGRTASKYFRGTFDGNGKTLYNLKVIASSYHTGLFGHVVGGTIKDLTISGANIESTYNNSSYYHGIIVGYLQNEAAVINCNVLDSKIKASSSCVGGIVGRMDNNFSELKGIIDCSVQRTDIEGKNNIGGICGYLNDGLENHVQNNTVDISTVLIGGSDVDKICGKAKDKTLISANNTDLSAIETPVIPLIIGKWNFVGNNSDVKEINVASLNNNGETLMNYSTAHDVAAANYDYQSNRWNDTYLSVKNNDIIKSGEGIFVWVFEKDKNEQDLSKKYGDIVYWTVGNNQFSESALEINTTNNESKNTEGQDDEVSGALWFALSNPFDEAVEVETLIGKLNNVQGKTQAYTWDGNKWNNNPDKIASGQGFMVAATDGKTNINGYLTKAAAKSEKQEDWIKFSCITNNSSFDIFATAKNNAQNSFDEYDSYILFSENNDDFVQPYFAVQGKSLIRNVFKNIPYTVDLNFRANKDNQIKFYVSNLPQDFSVMLIDKFENTNTILDDTIIDINLFEGENEDRFQLCFINKNVNIAEIQETNNEIKIVSFGNHIDIFGKDLTNVEVYDIVGHKRFSQKLSCDNYSFNLNSQSGIYILRISDLSRGGGIIAIC